MRLIDLDELLKRLEHGYHPTLKAIISSQPTIDAVPVVRCRDCGYRNKEYSETFCEVLGRLTNDNFYCKYGAKKDKEAEQE